MKTNFKALLSLLLIVSFISSCKKDAPDPIEVNSVATENARQIKKDLIISGHKSKSWVIYRYFVNGMEFTSGVPECNLDNVLTFYRNGKYVQTEGNAKCSPNDPELYDEGRWRLTNKRTTVLLEATRFNTEATIIELTENLFIVEFIDPSLGTVNFWLKPVSL